MALEQLEVAGRARWCSCGGELWNGFDVVGPARLRLAITCTSCSREVWYAEVEIAQEP